MTDIPVTAMPQDPCERDVSQSVPPQMRYGAPIFSSSAEPIRRCNSTQPARRHPRQPSFTPTVAPVRENVTSTTTVPPIDTTEADLANHAGWMRKRKTKLLRHEWQDTTSPSTGSQLVMLDNDADSATALENIDVDAYMLHAYSVASGSKLSAAFKKSINSSSSAAAKEASFAFSLIPEDKDSRRLFEKNKTHHFAVKSGKDRVEWMRKLMLAKALKKNEESRI